jgi:hypothetical protein
LVPDDANLRHLNVRICEQGIGAAAWDFPVVAHGPLGQIVKDAKTQFFWPIYSAIVHEVQLVGCQPMMGEERDFAPSSSAYGWKKLISSGSQQNLGQSGDDHHTSRVMESEERGLLDTSRERRVALECISSKSLCKQRALSVLPMSEKRDQISDDLHKALSRDPA